jgi:hypothetical protein
MKLKPVLNLFKLMNTTRLTFYILLTALVSLVGCSGLVHHPDPLAGWQGDFKEQPNQQIVSDYQNYIRTLSPEERKSPNVSDWLKDGTGQHAIVITIGINGRWWKHILIYDKDNKRIKTIKYASGDYGS